MKVSLSRRTNRSGMATIIVLAVLAIMLVYITANIRALNTLDKELKLVEQKQLKRLAVQNTKTLSATNTNTAAIRPATE